MKPAAAFTIGLWTGALVVVLAGAGRFACQLATPGAPPESAATLVRQQADLRRLDQANAQLTAEAQRLRQTLAELKSQPVVAVVAGEPVSAPLVSAPAADGQPAFAARVRLLDQLRQAVDDPELSEQLAQLREALLARWAEAGPRSQGD